MNTQQGKGKSRRYRSRSRHYKKHELSPSGQWLFGHIEHAGKTRKEFAELCYTHSGLYRCEIDPTVLSGILRSNTKYIRCVNNRNAGLRVLVMLETLNWLSEVTTLAEAYQYLV